MMKHIQKRVLTTVLLVISSLSQAELRELDDAELEKLVGQAGVTIDLEIKLDIGELVFRDGGSFVVQGIHIGANKNLKRNSGYKYKR